eukprot:9643043-Heterocapsa_arctica.AAC.1
MTRRKQLPERGGHGTSHARRTLRASRAPKMEEESSKEGDASRRFPQKKRHPKRGPLTVSEGTGTP